MGPTVVVIDNYDSFVYNLVQLLGSCGANVVVFRNDAVDIDGIEAVAPDGLLISPGPGRPEDAGIAGDAVTAFAGRIPVFGVCLGHQLIGQLYGASIVRAPELMHGKTSLVHHEGQGSFAGLSNPFVATRYHSLIVDPTTVPEDLVVTARTDDGVIMGLRHATFDVEGVQFHPESILSVEGPKLVRAFYERASA